MWENITIWWYIIISDSGEILPFWKKLDITKFLIDMNINDSAQSSSWYKQWLSPDTWKAKKFLIANYCKTSLRIFWSTQNWAGDCGFVCFCKHFRFYFSWLIQLIAVYLQLQPRIGRGVSIFLAHLVGSGITCYWLEIRYLMFRKVTICYN